MKTCTKCKIEKDLSDFSKASKKPGGLRFQCKSCDMKYNKANSEKISEYQKNYYMKTAEYSAERKRKYHHENRDRIAAKRKIYRSENSEMLTISKRNERAKRRKAEGKHTLEEIQKILEMQKFMCANCNAKLVKSGKNKYHVDHIMPLIKGGSNWPDNLQCLCPTCNLRKNAKDPIAWANENGRLL